MRHLALTIKQPYAAQILEGSKPIGKKWGHIFNSQLKLTDWGLKRIIGGGYLFNDLKSALFLMLPFWHHYASIVSGNKEKGKNYGYIKN